MYPPLPPFPVYPQQQRHPRQQTHVMPHYVQAAVMRMPLHVWQPHDAYGNNFAVMPSQQQPPQPPAARKAPAKPRLKKPASPSVVTKKAQKTEKTEKPEKAENATKATDKKKRSSAAKEDNQAGNDVVSPGLSATACGAPAKPAAPNVWPQPMAVTLMASSSELIKSIWSTTPLELSSMMLLARYGQRSSSMAKVSMQRDHRSNQETHEISSSSSSDSSVGDTSSTDTEDEEASVPLLKQYFGLHSFELFVCDADYEISPSPSKISRDNRASDMTQTSFLASCDAFAVPDYRKLFGLAPDAVPFCPSTASTVHSNPELRSDMIPPPHMMWWPGDWKCSNCGNHVGRARGFTVFMLSHSLVSISLDTQNFSYRDTCKRCREGRIIEAGFIFAPTA